MRSGSGHYNLQGIHCTAECNTKLKWELYKIYCEMAETAVEVCVACAQPVPVAIKRRRFRSASLSHILPTLNEIFTRVDPAATSAILDPTVPASVGVALVA